MNEADGRKEVGMEIGQAEGEQERVLPATVTENETKKEGTDNMADGVAADQVSKSIKCRAMPEESEWCKMTKMQRDEELMSDLYGVFIEEAGRNKPPDWDAAMKAVTETICEQIAAMEHGERCCRVAYALMDDFCRYADGIHRKVRKNIAKRKSK